MKICFLADARSPIAVAWIQHFVECGHEVDVISLFAAERDSISGATIHSIQLFPFSESRSEPAVESASSSIMRKIAKKVMTERFIWGQLAPRRATRLRDRLTRLVTEISPDLIHALRLPVEGEIAGMIDHHPLIISTWGNDLTLWAKDYRIHRKLTSLALRTADGLLSDTQRDLELAQEFGFPSSRPSAVLPGSGGIRLDMFHEGQAPQDLREKLRISDHSPVVLNPRGVRTYVRSDTWIEAIPKVLDRVPDAVFLWAGIRDEHEVLRLIPDSRVQQAVRLLPLMSRSDMADVYRLASILVSPSEHDGTPNTLLEGMATGCLPVLGDIESVREWIQHDKNGLLFNPSHSSELAAQIVRGMSDHEFRKRAATINIALIEDRANYARTMARAEEFYESVMTISMESR